MDLSMIAREIERSERANVQIVLSGIDPKSELPQLAARVSHNGWYKVTFTSVNSFVLCLVALVVEPPTQIAWKDAACGSFFELDLR